MKFVVVLLLAVPCFTQDTMTCSRTSDTFQLSSSLAPPNVNPGKGKPGKRGPVGLKGSKGMPGSKGEKGDVMEFQLLQQRVKILEQQLRNVTPGQLQCIGGVVVGRKCYKLPYRVGYRLNYNDAEALCAYQGGQLAEVTSEEVYNAIFNYVKRTWNHDLNNPGSNHIGVWFGGRYQNDNIVLSSGENGFKKWRHDSPQMDKNNIFVVAQIGINPRHPDREQNMWNAPATHIAVPVCQFTNE